ncbi:MAG: HD domain-containing protein [Euryarchaeota archaeon]|nr:HD domain-containing protein [Euryarchaeota archaeon]
MKFVSELEDGDTVNIILAVKKKLGLRDYRNKFGKFFILEAGDRTGSIMVKYWGDDDRLTEKLYSEIQEGDVIEIDGECRHDGYALSINVNPDRGFIKKVEHYDLTRFLEEDEEIEHIMGEIMKLIEQVKEPHLAKLLELFFSSQNFVESFKDAPAGTTGKYAVLGGLARHTLNVAKACMALGEIYQLNKELLLTAALLHDVGRLASYDVDTSIRIGARGKLLGHTVLSYNMVEERIREIVDFPEELKNMLLHAIIAHHSPIVDNVPQRIRTKEAYILFYADMLDLTMSEFSDGVDEEWTYSRKMGRELYTG